MFASKRRQRITTLLIAVGVVLLLVGLLTPWYARSYSFSGLPGGGERDETTLYYPGIPSAIGTIQWSCSGTGNQDSRLCYSPTSYSASGLNNTGIVVEATFFLDLAAAVAGTLAVILSVAAWSNSRRAAPAFVLAAIALILALSAPGIFALALPSALGKDTPDHFSRGPWASFFGSTSYPHIPGAGSENLTWGPTVGWYLSIGAAVFFLAGTALLFGRRRGPSSPAFRSAPESPSTPP
jgi:hypothetical protein